MIVRISSEGQYELSESEHGALDELDQEAVAACETGDERAFRDAFDRLLGLVREHGRRLREDEVVGSDVILPPPDLTMAEASVTFTGDGLIPS